MSDKSALFEFETTQQGAFNSVIGVVCGVLALRPEIFGNFVFGSLGPLAASKSFLLCTPCLLAYPA